MMQEHYKLHYSLRPWANITVLLVALICVIVLGIETKRPLLVLLYFLVGIIIGLPGGRQEYKAIEKKYQELKGGERAYLLLYPFRRDIAGREKSTLYYLMIVGIPLLTRVIIISSRPSIKVMEFDFPLYYGPYFIGAICGCFLIPHYLAGKKISKDKFSQP